MECVRFTECVYLHNTYSSQCESVSPAVRAAVRGAGEPAAHPAATRVRTPVKLPVVTPETHLPHCATRKTQPQCRYTDFHATNQNLLISEIQQPNFPLLLYILKLTQISQMKEKNCLSCSTDDTPVLKMLDACFLTEYEDS